MLGVGIVVVVMAPYIKESETLFAFKDFTNWSLDAITDYKNGIYLTLISVFGMAQFFGAPMLGGMSDQYGRKKVVIGTLLGGAFGYLIFSLGVILASLPLLFIGRFITGFNSGGVSILYSIIADVSTPENKAKNFGILGAAFGLGFIVGPALGAYLADPSVVSWFNDSTPFFTAMVLSILSGLLIYLTVPETYKRAEHLTEPIPLNVFQGFNNLKKAFSTPEISTVLTVLFLVFLGFTFFTQFSAVYLMDRFDVTQKELGKFFTFIGAVLVFTQFVVIRILTNYFSNRQIVSVVLFTLSCGLLLFLVPKNYSAIFYVACIMPISFGLMQPNMLSIISNSASKDIQGEILGIQQSVRSLAYMLPPLLSIPLSAKDVRFPNMVGAAIVFLSWLIFVLNYKKFGKKDTQ